MIECSANEFHEALIRMREEELSPITLHPFLEETIKGIKGWSPAMWIRLGMIIQEGKK